jgi:hypothetical protein
MERPFKHIAVDRMGDIACVSMRERRLSENDVQELTDELTDLIVDGKCRKLVFSFGPGSPDCLYSIFLAKLFTTQRRIDELGGKLHLCDATDDVQGVFEACHLKEFFSFFPDRDAAVAAFAGK